MGTTRPTGTMHPTAPLQAQGEERDGTDSLGLTGGGGFSR